MFLHELKFEKQPWQLSEDISARLGSAAWELLSDC